MDTGRVPDGAASPGRGRPEFRLNAVPSGPEKAENAARYAARRAFPVQKLSLGLIVGRKENLIVPLLDQIADKVRERCRMNGIIVLHRIIGHVTV